jgi:hypothetical protein
MRGVSSAFWLKMQSDAVLLTEIVDFDMPGGASYHWTSTNAPITYTLSGTATRYIPFPGSVPRGPDEDVSLSVGIMDFTIANSFADIQALLSTDDFRTASVKMGRVFTDTPDLGRMNVFQGIMGDFVHDRNQISGQIRNLWKSLNIRWPYYTHQDRCGLRFGGTMCGFNTASITVALNSVNVGSSTTLNLLVASGYLTRSYSNGRFDFGRLTVTAGPNSGHQRTIRSQSGDWLALSHPLPVNSLAGMQLSVYPGCRKTLIADCKSLYNNDKSFFGWWTIPVQEQAF